MATVSRAGIDPNHHKGIVAVDDVTGDPFAVQGDAATGAINVIPIANSGVTIGTVDQGVGAATGTSWRIKGDYLEASGSGASLNADIIASTDVSSYKWGAIQLTGTFSATIFVQGSNDSSTFVTMAVENVATATSALIINGLTTPGVYTFPIKTRYVRVRITTYTSGTVNGNLFLHTIPTQLNYNGVTANQGGTWTVQPGNTANTTAWLITDRGASSTPARVATSTTSAQLIAANASRKKVVIHNDSAGILYVKFGTTASATDFTYRLASQTDKAITKYTGRIDGILDTGTGNAQVSEVT